MQIQTDIEKIFQLLEDKSRFFCVEKQEKIWFYDAFAHSIYSIEKDIFKELKNDKFSVADYIEKGSLQDCAKLMNFFRIIENKSEDKIPEPLPDSKCNVMINTSNRCNLNCSYCYRNKESVCVNDLATIKKTIDFAMKRYKPEASEFVISYSMTSESSVDLKILKEVADEYIHYESYLFCDSDILGENRAELYSYMKSILFDKVKNKCRLPESDSKKEIVIFLNNLLGLRDLYEILNVTDRMFNDSARWQISQRSICAKWRLYRINRWILEVVFDKFLQKRHVPYVTFWFMTNGTCASSEFIDFVKSIDINPLWVSIDGSKEIHDENRKNNKGKGTYDEIIHNCNKMREAGIKLKASAVITTLCPRPLEIVFELLKAGFTQISMTPVRPGTEVSFTKENISELLAGYDEVYDKLKKDALKGNFSLFRLLKEDLILSCFNVFIGRSKLLKRCAFDDQIVVDSKGNLYPCLYFSGNKDFCYGNIADGIDRRKINHKILVNDRSDCRKCWARYLCGGTCFYGSYVSCGKYNDKDLIECMLKKHLAEKSLDLIIFLKEHNIPFDFIYSGA